jgi:hypothetical protein
VPTLLSLTPGGGHEVYGIYQISCSKVLTAAAKSKTLSNRRVYSLFMRIDNSSIYIGIEIISAPSSRESSD